MPDACPACTVSPKGLASPVPRYTTPHPGLPTDPIPIAVGLGQFLTQDGCPLRSLGTQPRLFPREEITITT
jgi:hypothetical protein